MQHQLPAPESSTPDLPIWYGSTGWRVDDGWATPLRLGRVEGLSDKLSTRARCAAGVRIELCTDAAMITLPIRPDPEIGQQVDLVVDDRLVERVTPTESGQLDLALPGRMARVEIWLPHKGICQVRAPRLSDANRVEAVPGRPRWIAYGSSITQCAAADGPSDTWPALVARRLGWDLTCFGFSGLALLDLPVAEVMAAARPDIATVCAGINIYNQATFTADGLADRLREFVRPIRAGRPDGALALLSPIASPERETSTNDVAMTLQDVRDIVQGVAAELPGVRFVSGTEVFGLSDADLLPDGLHPSAAGYRLMADRLTPRLAGLAAGSGSGAQGVLDQATAVVQQQA